MKKLFYIILSLHSMQVFAEPLHVVINGGLDFSSQTGAVDLQTTTSALTSIDLDTTSNLNLDLPSVLENTVGLQIQQSSGLGSFSTVSLRAASSEQVLVFLDGILLNDSVSGNVDLSLIPVNQIQRIEVFRGSTPVELGAASMGGAINIITRDQDSSDNIIGVSASSYDASRLKLHWSKTDDKTQHRLISEFINNGNNYPIINDNNTQYTTADDFKDIRHNAEVEQSSVFYTYKVKPEPQQLFENSLRVFSKRQNLPNFNNSPYVSAALDTDLVYLSSKYSRTPTDSSKINLSSEAYLRYKQEIFDDQASEIGLLQNYLKQKNTIAGIKTYLSKKILSSEWRTVLDLNQQSSSSIDLLNKLNDVNHHRQTVNLNIGYRKYLANGKTTLDTVMASEYVHDDLDQAYDYFNNPTPAQSRIYQFADLRFGFASYLSDNTRIKTNLGQYHRVPYLFELYGDRGFFHGNQDLREESSVNFDIGIDISIRRRNHLFDKSSLYLGYFNNQSKDLIIREYNSQGVGTPENLENANIQGIETTFNWPVKKKQHISINTTWLKPVIKSHDPLYDGNIIPGQFVENYYLSYSYSDYSWYYQLEYEAKKGMYYERLNGENSRAKDRELVNFIMKKSDTQNIFEFSVRNIFDRQYEDYHGYPKPGRIISLGYSRKF